MRNFMSVFVAAVCLASSATAADNSLISLIEKKMLETSFLSGKHQIMAANISSNCKELAFTNLAAAQQTSMICNTAWEISEDIGLILNEALESTGMLISDVNTVVNGVPSCFTDNRWWHFVDIVSCLVEQTKSIWNASIHFINYSDYYMSTINEIIALKNCIENSANDADRSVKKIVSMAMKCNIQ